MMKIGFLRPSINFPSIEVQKEALINAGCEKIFEEKASTRRERKQLSDLMEYVKKDDIVIVWKLSTFGVTTLELLKLINYFNEKEVHFKSLNYNLIDPTAPHEEGMFSIASELAELEREMIRERTNLGLASLRARGRVGGRPKGLSEIAKAKAKRAVKKYRNGDSITAIMNSLEIKSKATLYRYLRYEGLEFNYKKSEK